MMGFFFLPSLVCASGSKLPLQAGGAWDAGGGHLGIVGLLGEEPKAGIEAIWGGTNVGKIKG